MILQYLKKKKIKSKSLQKNNIKKYYLKVKFSYMKTIFLNLKILIRLLK